PSLLDEGDHKRANVQEDPKDLGIAEIELEHAGRRQTKGDRHTDLGKAAHRAIPASRALPQEKAEKDDVRRNREYAALSPELDEVVVQMRNPKARRVRLSIERINLFDIRGADA